MRIPIEKKWSQYNNSDLFGTLSASRNINLDEEGYLKLSSRTFSILSPDADADFGLPIAIGRSDDGDFEVVTEDQAFEVNINSAYTSLSAVQDTDGTGEYGLATTSWGTFWQNRWYVTSNSNLGYKTISTGDWQTNNLYSLTAGKTHALEVFRNRNTLCITDGNIVQQINTSHAESTLAQLTLPTDFEAVGLAYANARMGVITRLDSTVEGQGQDAYFFVWDGVSASANQGEPVGSDACVGIVSYKGTWIILTRTGQLRMWNGGGFQDIGAFPFYYKGTIWGGFLNKVGKGVNMWVEGDVVYINAQFEMSDYGRKQEQYLPYCPSGIWCFDPAVGLYHKYSPTLSNMELLTVGSINIDTSTDLFTISSGNIPETGGVMRYLAATSSNVVGGLTLRDDYYVIKVSSTTFRLATTRENAIVGEYINLTSVGGTNHYFLAMNVLDYGASIASDAAGIALTGKTTLVYDHMLFGTQLMDYDSTTALEQLNITVPEAEARGYFVTRAFQSDVINDTHQKLTVKHRPLTGNDVIVVKSKDRDIVGLPVSTKQNGKTATWVSRNEFYTDADLSDVVDALAENVEVECEIIAGAGAGQLVKVESVVAESGTYYVLLSEDVIGASTNRNLHAQFDNYKQHAIITADTQNDRGYFESPVTGATKWIKYKIELRGVNTTIESIDVQHVPHKTL